ncbi:MAG: 4Fe-4S binding protein [Clostridia bacterium]|nr:4Fe-4S binding protein [Clostridia bacterium]
MTVKERFARFRKDRPKMNALKRKALQIAAFGFTNAAPGNFLKGTIDKGAWKRFCAPGMNCYSCPAAKLACPIGALQAVNGSMDFSFSFYVVGLILAVGALTGRFLCGWLCPFGLVQELLHKLPTKKFRLPKPLTYVKYILCAVFVFLLPVLYVNFMGMGAPAFCQYLCPVGTLEGGIPLLIANESLRQLMGPLFWWKALLLAVTLTGCVFICRFFCKLACPLGALLGLMNRISAWHLEVDATACVHCGRCAAACPMDVDPVAKPGSCECIRCGKCKAVCPTGALRFRFGYGDRKKQTDNND